VQNHVNELRQAQAGSRIDLRRLAQHLIEIADTTEHDTPPIAGQTTRVSTVGPTWAAQRRLQTPEHRDDSMGATVGQDLLDRTADSRARRRAALTLAAIALSAVIVGLLMVAITRTPSGHKQTVLPSLRKSSAEPASPNKPDTSSSHRSPVAAAPAPSTSTRPSTTPCRPTPCVLTGDPGNVVAAINALRASQAQPAVTGSAAQSAALCAVHSGDAPYCAGSYYWTPVSTLQGAEVVSKIAGYGNGRSWLLDPHLTKIAVGWAEASPNQYECAVYDVSQQH
jgi:hypothetical protein